MCRSASACHQCRVSCCFQVTAFCKWHIGSGRMAWNTRRVNLSSADVHAENMSMYYRTPRVGWQSLFSNLTTSSGAVPDHVTPAGEFREASRGARRWVHSAPDSTRKTRVPGPGLVASKSGRKKFGSAHKIGNKKRKFKSQCVKSGAVRLLGLTDS